MKFFVSPFILKQLSYWCVAALSTFTTVNIFFAVVSIQVFFISSWQAWFAFCLIYLVALTAVILKSLSCNATWSCNLNSHTIKLHITSYHLMVKNMSSVLVLKHILRFHFIPLLPSCLGAYILLTSALEWCILLNVNNFDIFLFICLMSIKFQFMILKL